LPAGRGAFLRRAGLSSFRWSGGRRAGALFFILPYSREKSSAARKSALLKIRKATIALLFFKRRLCYDKKEVPYDLFEGRP
jgi:hypothetical protein